MKNGDLWKLAFQNLSAGKKTARKAIIGIAVCLFLLLCYVGTGEILIQYRDSFDKDNAKDRIRYYFFNTENSYVNEMSMFDTAPIEDREAEAFLREMKKEADAKMDRSVGCDVAVQAGAVWKKVPNQRMTVHGTKLILDDGCEYSFRPSAVMNAYENTVHETYSRGRGGTAFQIALFNESLSPFPNGLFGEGREIMLAGSLPENPGEIMLDEYLLKVYGIDDENPEKLIGKSLSVLYRYQEVNNKKEEVGDPIDIPVLEKYVISGIFRASCLDVRENYTYDCHLEHIYVNIRPEEMKDIMVDRPSMRIFYNSFEDLASDISTDKGLISAILEKLSEDKPGELKMTEKGYMFCILQWILTNVGKLLIALGLVGIAVITFALGYILKFYNGRNLKFLTMLSCIGMRKKDRNGLYLREMILMGSIAYAAAFYVYTIYYCIFTYFLKQGLDFYAEVNMPVMILAFMAGCLWLTLFAGGIRKKTNDQQLKME